MKKKYLNFVLFLMFFLVSFSKVYDGDTFFHIKIGEQIINNGFFNTDPFSIYENLKYIPYAYGFDVLIYLVYSKFSFTGIVFFKYVYTAILYGLLAFALYKSNNNSTKSIILAGITVILMNAYIRIRPQLSSYLILIIQIYIMTKWTFDKKTKLIWLIPVTFIALSNLHTGTCLFHMCIVASFGLDLFISYNREKNNIEVHNFFKDRSFYIYLAIVITSILCICINPYFPDCLTFSLKTMGDTDMMQIMEWQSPKLLSLVGICTLLLAMVSVCFYDLKKNPFAYIVIFIATLMLNIRSLRFFPYFLLASSLIINNANLGFKINNKYINKIFSNKSVQISMGLCSIVVIYVLISASFITDNIAFNIPDKTNPKTIVEYINKNNLNKKRIYNDYNQGAYLIFNNINVFIDQRADLYSKNFNNVDILKDALDTTMARTNIIDTIKKYDLEYAIVNKDSLYYRTYIKANYSKFNVLVEDDYFELLQVK